MCAFVERVDRICDQSSRVYILHNEVGDDTARLDADQGNNENSHVDMIKKGFEVGLRSHDGVGRINFLSSSYRDL